MNLYIYLNIPINQRLQFSDDRFYAYGGLLLNCETGEMITLNDEETPGEQLGITKFPFKIRNKNGRLIYEENSSKKWAKYEYDANGKEIRYENSNGFWTKWVYDANGNQTIIEDSTGYWAKREFDANGKEIRYENSEGNKNKING